LTASLRDKVQTPPLRTRLAQAVVLILLAIPLLSAVGCTTEPRYEIRGANAYMRYGDSASGVLIVVDGRVFLLRPGEQDNEVELHAEGDEEIRGQPVWVPFVVNTDDGYCVWYFVSLAPVYRDDPLFVYQQTPDDMKSLSGDEVVAAFRALAAQGGQPLIPVMFPEQYYRFQDGGDWYEVTVTTTEGKESYRYHFALTSLDKEPDSIVGAPGYDVLDLSNHRTLWLFQDWKIPESIGERVNASVDELEQFFGFDAPLPPLHMIIGPPGLYRDRVGSFSGYALLEYSAATINSYSPDAQCVEDQGSSLLCSLMRHEITHIVHHGALLQAGRILDCTPWWLREGLASVLGSSDDDGPYGRELAALAATHHVTPLDPEEVDALINPRDNPNYTVAAVMVGYLMDQFGPQVVADYATHPTFRRRTEDQLMQEYFDLNRSQLFEAALNSYEAPLLPVPDYVITNWELLGGPELANQGFTLNPAGTKAAALYDHGTEIGLLDLETRKIKAVLRKQPEDLGLLGPISWFPDGQRIAFTARPQGIASIYSMDIDDPDTLEPLVESDAQDSGAAIGPDGRYVAFRSERTGHSELYLLDLDTDQVEQLTTEESNLVWPSWSPDGGRIASVDADRNRLGVLDLATRGIEWMSLEPYGTFTASRPCWLSAKRVIVNVRDPEYHVVALDFDLSSHTGSTWGAADIWPRFTYFDVMPGSFPPRFIVRARVYSDGQLYDGLMQVDFEEGE